MTARGGAKSRKRNRDSSSNNNNYHRKDSNNDNSNGVSKKNTKHKQSPKTLQKVANLLSISTTTLQAVSVLSVAILCGVVFNWWDQSNSITDPRIQTFLQQVCDSSTNEIFCHPSLIAKRRTQMAVRKIHRGERILEVPRSLQVWALDALRHSFILENVKGAKHAHTDNPVDSAAYLALYLALLDNGNVTLTGNENNDGTTATTNSPYLLNYLHGCLPSQDDLAQFHPQYWNETELKEMLPLHSATFRVTMAYREMVHSEYIALADRFDAMSPMKKTQQLEDYVSQDAYTRFRVLVLSRSFGTGPLPIRKEATRTRQPDDSSLTYQELEFYRNEFGIDMSKGSYAMVPILDFYDHHATPNVEYAYSPDKRVFAIQSSMTIAPGQEIVDNYGKYTDSHLFAKFGFVNGDGSGLSQASLATQHVVMDSNLKQQFSHLPFRKTQTTSETLHRALQRQAENMIQYLRFDDGYEDCIFLKQDDSKDDEEEGDDNEVGTIPPEAYQLKRLKLQHLQRIANHAQRWQLILLPRTLDSLPARASNIPITMVPPKITKRHTKFFHRREYELLAATCRLMSLRHDDYDGEAANILETNLHNNSFLLHSQLTEDFVPNATADNLKAALEFRTHFCLARLASEALQRFGPPIADLEALVARLNRDSFQSKEWTAAHLVLGEMQALEVLRGVSFAAAREYESLRNQSPPFFIRDRPCPLP